LFEAVLQGLQPSTQLALSCGLSLSGGWSRCLSVQAWKKQAPPVLDAPTVFAIGR
jgi:16S rRNA (cytidine1402-2'-O)-methyltransferase